MFDPWADALATMHSSDMAVPAIYTPADGDPVEIRVVLSTPTEEMSLNARRMFLDTSELQIRRADVAAPTRGDTVTIAGEKMTINSAPMLDVEGLSWTCWADRERHRSG